MTGKHRYLLRVRGEDFALRLEVESREEVEKRLSEESFARVLPTQYFLEYLDEEENCYVRVLKADELPEGGHLRVSPLYGLDQPPPPYYPPLDKSVLDTTPGRIYQYFGEPHLPMYMSPPTPKYVTPPAPPYVSPPAPPGAPTSLNKKVQVMCYKSQTPHTECQTSPPLTPLCPALPYEVIALVLSHSQHQSPMTAST
ncbi:unnamed protein product [Darwinula stevensoni]|uniref:Uncharacterized protein n=1 Tax=Darwinula stevensoni TaxID=69355 RepID=A0A7R9A849_9CRUS|nr:unnamed protein product [Darwinula stevensoni]CAG0895391.1 unnamed protein product [Darwinula stevensoni]